MGTPICGHCERPISFYRNAANELVQHPHECSPHDLACPTCHSGHIIGVEVSESYDGVLFWRCENRHSWHRFPEGHYLRVRAAPFVTEPDAAPSQRAVAPLSPPTGTEPNESND